MVERRTSDEVAVDHRNVSLVICHLGNPWLVDCMEVVYKNANVYADFSGLILGEFTEAFEDYMEEQIGEVILYADVLTQSIKNFLATSEYRRTKQIAYNKEHNITPAASRAPASRV